MREEIQNLFQPKNQQKDQQKLTTRGYNTFWKLWCFYCQHCTLDSKKALKMIINCNKTSKISDKGDSKLGLAYQIINIENNEQSRLLFENDVVYK